MVDRLQAVLQQIFTVKLNIPGTAGFGVLAERHGGVVRSVGESHLDLWNGTMRVYIHCIIFQCVKISLAHAFGAGFHKDVVLALVVFGVSINVWVGVGVGVGGVGGGGKGGCPLLPL